MTKEPVSGPGAGDDAPAASLIFDDPLAQRSSDDLDLGWGERPDRGAAGGPADLVRLLDEVPPHHL